MSLAMHDFQIQQNLARTEIISLIPHLAFNSLSDPNFSSVPPMNMNILWHFIFLTLDYIFLERGEWQRT